MSAMIETLTKENKNSDEKDGKIHAVNIMGDMFSSMSQEVEKNDIKGFKEYLESDKSNIEDYVSNIKYGYNITMNLYKEDEEIVKVNPTTIFDSIGMSTAGISNAYSGYLSNYDVFYEMLDNQELNEQQYDLVAGKWPEKYNELVLQIDKNNQIADYALYSLGILSQDDLKEQFNNMISGKEVTFESTSYEIDDLLGLTFKLVLNTDYYQKKNGLWLDMSNDEDYLKKIIKNAPEIKIVGIIKPNDEAVSASGFGGMVGYRSDLTEYLINEINKTAIAKEQLEKENINIFTGKEFGQDKGFNINDLTPQELQQLQSLSEIELAEYMKNYSDNAKATYEQNLSKLGIIDLEDPDSISLYPKDFDSKEEITKIIEDYNKGKEENEKINYTDIVGIMMSSVSTIVDVISSVLIAFVAISLIVSSIMIAIITYISVIERTKEIGILRAMGASKKDISRVFNAETLIEGFAAGLFGIIVTVLLNIPINIIIKKVVNISNISVLPLTGAVILIVISILLTVIAGFIPAKIASKKDPVVALRTE